MAKRKSSSRARRFYARMRTARRGRSSGRGSGSLLMTVLGAAIYGAVRSPIASAIQPLTNQLPLGNISDEAGMIALSYLSNRFIGGKIPLISNITRAGLLVEGARIGEAITTGSLGSLGGIGGNAPMQSLSYGSGMNVYS